jgi:hypothetical protein
MLENGSHTDGTQGNPHSHLAYSENEMILGKV